MAYKSEKSLISAASCVCVPFDIFEVDLWMEKYLFGCYHRWMGKNKVKTLMNHFETWKPIKKIDGKPLLEVIQKIKTTRDFDTYFVAPQFGFSSAQSLYRKASCVNHLSSISIPILFLSSLNDPVIPYFNQMV